MSMLALPNRHGWCVEYEEERIISSRNGEPESIKKVPNILFRATKEEADKLAEELKAKGRTVYMVTECIY